MSRVILEDIINQFEPGKFTRFFREKNSKFAPREELYQEYDDENFVKGLKLGEIVFNDTEKLVVVTFEAKQPLSERSGKRAQYEKGKRILKEKQYDTGIFIFYDTSGNFRFSLIYANYLGRRRDWSAFRRFTYFVSSNPESTNKTFKHRIEDADFSTLEKIKDAFSVEKVTQSFYTDIANWYFWAVQNSKFPNDSEEENGRNIAIIRLVTRLIFIWFMKVKGLIPEKLFFKSEIDGLLNNLNPNETTYYKAILQNLFFSTLNTKIKDRKYRFQNPDFWINKDYMNHCIYRYEGFFKDNNAMLGIFKDIPFLNGGLFDCLDRASKDNNDQGEIRIDGFSDKDVGLRVPNILFFSDVVEADLNKEYGTSNKKYHVRGLLDILQSYNFTIDENDPNDQEVALDPELLGKVFENLLASFNPETASTARKATGSYYTPREIVDYMVSESLKNYFKTSLEIEGIDDKLTSLFSVENDENLFDTHQTLKLVQLINDLRVVDPAVGSGAFPMGILNKLVFILGKLDPDNTLWKNAQIKAIETGVTDPLLKKQLTDQVDDRFTNKNLDYGRKLYLIQKCIYGVDIQQIAVEIAKLRFFISLLVDEKIDKSKENWGVEPLPNLDYKIMQGNSLLEEYEGIKLFDERLLNVTLPDESESKEIEEKMKVIQRELQPYYVKEPRWMRNPKLERPQELIVLESEINRLRLAQKDLIKFNQAKIANGNQEQLKFQAEEGQSQEVWVQLQDLHKKLFTPTLTRNDKREIKKEIDRLEWRLIEATLREQNKTKELEKIEKMENSNTKPFFLWRLYFPEVFEEKKGFDIVIANPPYSLEKQSNVKTVLKRLYRTLHFKINLFACFIEKGTQLLNSQGIMSYIIPNLLFANDSMAQLREYLLKQTSIIKLLNLGDGIFDVVTMPTMIIILNKYNVIDNQINVYPNVQNMQNLGLYFTVSQRGYLDNYNFVFETMTLEDKSLINRIELNSIILGEVLDINQGVITGDDGRLLSTEKRDEDWKPTVRGKDIDKYIIHKPKLYVCYKPEILACPRTKDLFESNEKILLRRTGDCPIGAYDADKLYNLHTLYSCRLKSANYPLKLLLALLNSQLFKYIYQKRLGTEIGRIFAEIKILYMRQLPVIKIMNDNIVNNITLMVDDILNIAESGSLEQINIKDKIREIDKQVYQLYGLNDEEIKIVEGGE